MCVLLSFTILGCKSEDPVESKFIKELNAFCVDIEKIDATINQLCPTDPESLKRDTATFLNQIEKLSDSFKVLANISYPEKYENLKPLAKSASEYMDKAISEFTEAYGIEYDPEKEKSALDNYRKACYRMQMILSIVRGEDTYLKPSDDNAETP